MAAAKIHNGVLKELGPAVIDGNTGSSLDYSYIEFNDGQVVRNVHVEGGLEGKLEIALKDPGVVELHVIPALKKHLLVAVRTSDGKVFANDLSGGLWMQYALMVVLVVFGVPLIAFFGFGLILLWLAWRGWKGIDAIKSARRHIQALANVVVV